MNKDSQRPDFNCSFIIAIKQTPTKSTHFTPIHHTKPMCRKRAKDEDMLENPYGQTSQLLHSAIAPRSLCRRKTLIGLNSISRRMTDEQEFRLKTTHFVSIYLSIYIYIWSFLNLICSAMSFFHILFLLLWCYCYLFYKLFFVISIYLFMLHPFIFIKNTKWICSIFVDSILTLIFYFDPLYILIIGCYILLP